MRISSKSRHAITSMLDLGRREKNESVTLAELAEVQNISLSYLEQIFADLRAKGLVKGRRGPGGGYLLARDTADISVMDIICAVDEWVDYSFNGRQPFLVNRQPMSASGLWNRLSSELFEHLSSITLASVVADAAAEDQGHSNVATGLMEMDEAA